jgi:hypothetical protein
MLIAYYLLLMSAVILYNVFDYLSSVKALASNPNAKELNPILRWTGLFKGKIVILGFQLFAFSYSFWKGPYPAETGMTVFVVTLAYIGIIIHNYHVASGTD